MYKCTKCFKSKEKEGFYKNLNKKNGLYSYCKDCHKKITRLTPRDRRSASKTAEELIVERYNGLVARCGKSKNYENVKLLISREDFLSKFYNLDYIQMYKNWVKSGYDNKLAPSVDRIDPKGDYSAGNIRWLTRSDNARLGKKGHRAIPVSQYSKDGVYINTFKSMTEACKKSTWY